MRIEAGNTDETVLGELGSRLARTRLERNVTQAELAREAGVAKGTVERIERGSDVNLTSLLRVLRALGLLEALDRLVPEPLPSPIERLRLQGRRRRRAARPRGPAAPGQDSPWTWGVDASGAEVE